MKSLLVLTFCVPAFLQAQRAEINAKTNNPISPTIKNETSGIIWVDNLNWQQVKKKAKKDNKYIFVDCYATWCGPCKKMDQNVYANDSVGDFINDRFISVKLQMDSSKADNESIRSWYKIAKEMRSAHRVASYPTFLFFSPDGEVVYKDFGYKVPDKFMQVAHDALTPSKQYYVLLKEYKKGKRDYLNMPYLITMSKQLGDTTNYRPLLTVYYDYLQSLDRDKLYTKGNIEFIASTISKSGQAPFGMFYPDGKLVDNVMNKDGYARNVVDQVIIKEKVNPFLRAAEGISEPDWISLQNAITKDYNEAYADRAVLEAKLKWYQHTGNDLKFTTAINDKLEKYGTDTTSMGEDFRLNSLAFLMFEKITDPTELKRIISWMAGVVRRSEKSTGNYIEYRAYYIDTYANLLYKVGEKTEALKWQEIAVLMGRELGISKDVLKAIEANFEMMKKGEPTW